MSLIYIIEDEPVMADCIGLCVQNAATALSGQFGPIEFKIFNDAVTAMSELDNEIPDLILLDVLLSGPDGFTFLNELISYHDTAHIPVVLITTLDMSGRDLSHYGVIGILNKATMTPEDIKSAIIYAFSRKVNQPTLPTAEQSATEGDIIEG